MKKLIAAMTLLALGGCSLNSETVREAVQLGKLGYKVARVVAPGEVAKYDDAIAEVKTKGGIICNIVLDSNVRAVHTDVLEQCHLFSTEG